VRLVEDFDQGTTPIDAVDDVDTVHHRAGRTIPLGHDQDVTCAERSSMAFSSCGVTNVLGARLLAEDLIASLRP